MLTRSIRWRMQIWQAFLLGCVLTGFGITAYQLHRTNLLGQVDDELERRLAAVTGDVRRPPGFGRGAGPPPFSTGRAPSPDRLPEPDSHGPRGWPRDFLDSRKIEFSPRTLSLLDETDAPGLLFIVWSPGGKILARSTNAPPSLPRPPRFEPVLGVHCRTHEGAREAYQFTEIGDCVLVARPVTGELRALDRFAGGLVFAGGGVLALGLGGGWLLASRAMRPLEDIGAIAGRISAGNLAERINLSNTDNELGRLAGVLNSTFARLEAAFAEQKQFTADASHELRTPIAIMISEAQTTLARERTAGEYRETLESCLETAQEMRRLTQSLLELARYDAGQEPLHRRPFDLAHLVRGCIERVQPLARTRTIQIQANLSPAATTGDPDRLDQVLINLLTNAIHYNRDRGEVRVTVCAEAGSVVVTVTDTGPGVAPADLPHVFERFYRADASRARTHGHSGLGLAICRAIVDAHGGTLEVASPPGAGATFTLRLPT